MVSKKQQNKSKGVSGASGKPSEDNGGSILLFITGSSDRKSQIHYTHTVWKIVIMTCWH